MTGHPSQAPFGRPVSNDARHGSTLVLTLILSLARRQNALVARDTAPNLVRAIPANAHSPCTRRGSGGEQFLDLVDQITQMKRL